jgi:hypothetical protein
MTGSSNFDLMPTHHVAGLIGGPVAPSSARWTAPCAKLAGVSTAACPRHGLGRS